MSEGFPPDVFVISERLPDTEGLNGFVIAIRDPTDPERRPRHISAQYGAVWLKWKSHLKKTTVEQLAEDIYQHLSDGVARTFNRISVEMIDKTADITCRTKFEDALWHLVVDGRVEYTVCAPIMFGLRSALAWTGHGDIADDGVGGS